MREEVWGGVRAEGERLNVKDKCEWRGEWWWARFRSGSGSGSGSGSMENIMDPDPAKWCGSFGSRSAILAITLMWSSHWCGHLTDVAISLMCPSHWCGHFPDVANSLMWPSHWCSHHTYVVISLVWPTHCCGHHTDVTITLMWPSHWWQWWGHLSGELLTTTTKYFHYIIPLTDLKSCWMWGFPMIVVCKCSSARKIFPPGSDATQNWIRPLPRPAKIQSIFLTLL